MSSSCAWALVLGLPQALPSELLLPSELHGVDLGARLLRQVAAADASSSAWALLLGLLLVLPSALLAPGWAAAPAGCPG